MITWDGLDWIAPAEDVRTTALDLVTCAAYAEMMMQLIIGAGIPAATVSAFTTVLLQEAGRSMFGTPRTMTLTPAGDSKRKQPLVLLHKGTRDAMLTPGEARGMALAWLQAAEASDADPLIAEALRATGSDGPAIESVFGYLRSLRERVTNG
jgi:hypothetical protein